ncbi:STAS domain-containing protein [Nonomuraea sp. NPDC050556]|uniref:STAS domain-containing protein n=1 Tax=Nonomuraea sp. NPDC050556 TaxID=3364369 RepID=UPI00378A001C
MDLCPRIRPARSVARGLLSSTTSRPDGTVVLSVHGELDIATEMALRELVFATLEHHGPRLVLDLDGVTFCDVGGLRAVLGCVEEAASRGGGVALDAIPAQMLHVMRMSELAIA